MILLGSIQRYELERLLFISLSHDQKVNMDEVGYVDGDGDTMGGRATPPGRDPSADAMPTQAPPPDRTISKPRFVVTKVDESSQRSVEVMELGNMLNTVSRWFVCLFVCLSMHSTHFIKGTFQTPYNHK